MAGAGQASQNGGGERRRGALGGPPRDGRRGTAGGGARCGPRLAAGRLRYRGLKTTFKMERTHSGQVTTLRLIGRLESECLGALKDQIEHSGPQVVLDLAELELVDLEVVRFLMPARTGGRGSRTVLLTYANGCSGKGNQGCNYAIVNPCWAYHEGGMYK